MLANVSFSGLGEGANSVGGNHRAIVWVENCPPSKINSPLKIVGYYSDLKLCGPHCFWTKAIRGAVCEGALWDLSGAEQLVLFPSRWKKRAKMTQKTSVATEPCRASLCHIASTNSLPTAATSTSRCENISEWQLPLVFSHIWKHYVKQFKGSGALGALLALQLLIDLIQANSTWFRGS